MNNLDFLSSRRLIILCGHYGSGKTNVAVNLALEMKRFAPQRSVALADMDIVNPYFRAADSADELRSAGILPVLPQFANTNVDIPSLPPELFSLLLPEGDMSAVIDVGGDDGAVALGMYADIICECGYEMLYIVNRFRPLTSDPADAAALMRDIEAYSHLKCTAVVNNSSLGNETTAEDIISSLPYAHECARLCSLPLLFTSYFASLAKLPEVQGEAFFPMKNVTKRMF